MNGWELTDEEIEQEVECAEYEYADSVPEEGRFNDEETLVGQRAIATAAQKKLVEWLIVEFDTPTLTQEFVDKWARLKAALGVKE